MASKTQKRPTAKTAKASAASPKATAPAIKAELVPDQADRDASLLKRRDLLNRIAKRSSLSKGDLRTTLDLFLTEIGAALDEGHDLALAPLGKLRLVRRKDGGETPEGAPAKADVLTLKLRRRPAKDAPSAPSPEA
ncbi:MAG: HU family DNA-binding protein [Pseudomonadota bacterium]